MKITADTNVLVRAMTGDDAHQSRIAQDELANAEMVALALPALCELVWVLAWGYRIAAPDIARAIRRLTDATNVAVNRPAVEAGLALLEAGGDFADGVIAYEGHWLGAEAFVSFERNAVELVQAQGRAARLLGSL
jgi:predicted nucleic-acid-binding protein